jgi:diadenosine tetraphosphatase ApaH/serine/threonine PP2A family protein phosphatase
MLAILYDIHGNRPALEAVLEDARAAGADRFLLGGDYAAFGAWPVECVERLRELGDAATWIRGNWERWQGDPGAAPEAAVVQGAAAAAIGALGDAMVRSLAVLPASVTVGDTLFCHASPLSDVEPFTRDGDADDEDQLLHGVTAPRVIFGHTHLQFRRRSAGGIELVNPGSAGLPWDGDVRAAYALQDDGGAVELRRVAYDVEEAAGALDAIDEPWAATTARRLRAAAFDV